MRKLILVVHVSLDGFVAGPNGELDDFPVGDDNLAFVNTLTENADATLMGRISLQLLDDFWPMAKDRPEATDAEIAFSKWYNRIQKIIISRTLPDGYLNNATIIRENLVTEVTKIKKLTGKDVLIFGSPSVSQTLMQHGMIDDYWIFVNPVLFNQGIPLFTGLTNRPKLKLITTKQLLNGEIALHYSVDSR